MNFQDICKNRESTRSFTGEKIDREILESIIDDVSLAPSACNSQPWKFIICDGDMAKNFSPSETHWKSKAAAFIVVCETEADLGPLTYPSQYFAQMDIGIAAASICYSATSKGIGSVILGCFTESKIKELLSIPENVTVRLIVALGYGNTELRPKIRKEKSEIMSFNSWN